MGTKIYQKPKVSQVLVVLEIYFEPLKRSDKFYCSCIQLWTGPHEASTSSSAAGTIDKKCMKNQKKIGISKTKGLHNFHLNLLHFML